MKRRIAFILSLAVAAALFVLFDRSFPLAGARIPPPGRFLDPFGGVWRTADPTGAAPLADRVPGIESAVEIAWDDRDVPHVFAGSTRDLYVAQGWITARDRLWQMEFQARAAAGRLAEIVGPVAVPLDRYHRRMGIPRAAERALDTAMADPSLSLALEAYAAGVNAWIDRLDDRSLPLEYKVLDYRPERWTPLHSMLFLKSMAATLSGPGPDRQWTRAREVLGPDVVAVLYPDIAPLPAPMAAAESMEPFEPIAVEPPDSVPAGHDRPVAAMPGDPARGSNAWAVSGSRTASGHAVLANDPHLPLTLPAVWYEMQLSGPDHSVYGVTMPGMPGVVLGFNRDVAWGATNAETDVLDWLRIEFRDDSLDEYRNGDAWRAVEWREERIEVRGGAEVVERVPYTHHGPVVCPPGGTPPSPRVPPGAALLWTAHQGTTALGTFLDLNRARTVEDVEAAVARYDSPGQNFLFAFRDGTIAAWHAGRFPVRWPGQGQFVGDGSDPAYDWQAFIPGNQLPHARDPDRGYLVSANQHPAGSGYPYPLGRRHAPTERARRIEEMLAARDGWTVDELAAMQNDVVSLYARRLLPVLRNALDDVPAGTVDALAIVDAWDLRYDADAVAPLIFDRWQREFWAAVWDDDLVDGDGALPRPRRDVSTDLLLSGKIEPFLDDRATDEVETLEDLATAAWTRSIEALETRLGPVGPQWAWGEVRRTRIPHLSRIPGLGRPGLRTAGQYGLVRAVTSSAGPSWRLVVEMGPDPVAVGIYPGGQAGDPARAGYDDRVDDWVAGRVHPLPFLSAPDDDDPSVVTRTTLEPAP